MQPERSFQAGQFSMNPGQQVPVLYFHIQRESPSPLEFLIGVFDLSKVCRGIRVQRYFIYILDMLSILFNCPETLPAKALGR
jgi:hypothetical protein